MNDWLTLSDGFWKGIERVYSDLDRSFYETFHTNYYGETQKTTDKDFTLTIDVPGVKRSDVNVKTLKDVLTITTKRNNVPTTRTWAVRSDFDLNTATSKLEDGVLTITVLKREKKPEELARTVEVR